MTDNAVAATFMWFEWNEDSDGVQFEKLGDATPSRNAKKVGARRLKEQTQTTCVAST